MKVSINLAQQYSNVDLKAIPRTELLKRIGNKLGAVEKIIDWAPKLEGAVVVKVISAEKHPDANRLKVCQVDDGSGELTQVVCGAPNVRAGMFGVWLKPGVIVPSSRGSDLFVLKAREIRGKLSHGMMASSKELGISDEHEGILEVDPAEIGREPELGEALTNFYGLDDFIIDCENKMFTHRPDCFGNIGVARELAGISGLSFNSPDWYLVTPQFEAADKLDIDVRNDIKEQVPRFMAVVMHNVKVKQSPVWLQAFLTRVGIKPINNVVDVTNYVMHLTGQPLHAFDYDKLKEHSNVPSLMPRISEKGEKLLLLGKKEIELTGNEIVIATDKMAIALAGVMGGAETEVDNDTKNIVIEAATFDMYSIRKTSMRFGLFTDAVTRFNKGQSPAQNDRVLSFAMEQMAKLTDAQQASSVYDLARFEQPGKTVQLSVAFVNERLGSHMDGRAMCSLLNNVEFEAETDDINLVIKAPFWRMDISLAEDIVEEIGRLFGYNLLPVALPLRAAKAAAKNQLFEFKQELRNRLRQAGANEVLTYSFVHSNLLLKTGTDPEKYAHHIRNAISPDLQYLRTSLMPSILAKVHNNIKAQAGSDNNQFALFEIGKAHVKGQEKDGLPEQMERLALVFAADDKTAKARLGISAYYQAKNILDYITDYQASFRPIENYSYPITAPFLLGRSATVSVGSVVLGVIGELNESVQSALKLPSFTAGFELDIQLLQKYLKPLIYQILPGFPSINQDITIEVGKMSFSDVRAIVEESLIILTEEHNYSWQLSPEGDYRAEDISNRKITFKVILWHQNRTLTTQETNSLVASLITNTQARIKV